MAFNLMPITRTNCEPLGLQSTFDGILRDFFAPGSAAGPRAAWSPVADVVETSDHYALSLEIPGIAPEDLTITVEGDTLTLGGEKNRVERKEGESWHMGERAHGSFQRTFKFPHVIGESDVTAEAANGIVTVRVQKAKEAQAREIKVKAL